MIHLIAVVVAVFVNAAEAFALFGHAAKATTKITIPYWKKQSTGQRRRRRQHLVSQQHHDDDHDDEKQQRPQEEIVMACEYCAQSKPLPLGTTKQEAASFLLQEETLGLIYGAGGTRSVRAVDATPELLDLWRASINYFDEKETIEDQPPTRTTNDRRRIIVIVAVETIISLPGLKLIMETANGILIKRVSTSNGINATCEEEEDVCDLVEYHAYLVGERSKPPQGLAPAVWLYNKLAGHNKSAGQENEYDSSSFLFLPPSGNAKSVFSIVVDEDKNNKKCGGSSSLLSFALRVHLQVLVKFPRTLLKILPLSQEQMARQGSNAIGKAIKRDVNRAVTATYDAFCVAKNNKTAVI